MSKPSIRTGSSSIPSASRRLGERLDPALAPVLAAQPVLVEGEAGVALGQLAQAALVAALGHPHLDRAAAALAQRRREQLGAVAQVGADDDRRAASPGEAE